MVVWVLFFCVMLAGFGSLAIYSAARDRWIESGCYLFATTLIVCALSDTLWPAVLVSGCVVAIAADRRIR